MRFGLFLCVPALVAATAPLVPGRAFDRFFTIWLENQDFANVVTDADLVDLKSQGILLTGYHGLTHPSQPNYIASIAGDYFGLDHDGYITIPNNVSTLVDLFDTKRIPWKGYFEGIPGPGYMSAGSTAQDGSGWDYVRKHNPFAPFDSVTWNGSRILNLQSFVDFQHDVEANTLPQYAHLSPNMLNDGHNTSLAYATNWTRSFLTPLLANEEFMKNTLILLTYDESETYSKPNRVVSLLLGGAVPDHLRGSEDGTLYSHYSILSTLENNWELPNLGRYDVGANVFDLVAQKTGYINHPPEELVNNSLSYDGFLNHNPAAYLPIPPPNLQLVGAGGQGVAPIVKRRWRRFARKPTPYDGSGILHDGGDGQGPPDNAPVYKPQTPNVAVTATYPARPVLETAPAR